MNIHGRYVVDPEKSAILMTGYFTDRFEMKPGYEQAVEQFLKENGATLDGIAIEISADTFRLSSLDGEEQFDVISTEQQTGAPTLVVDWEGVAETFIVRDMGNQCIQLDNAENELSHFAWRKEA
ncbi:MAG: hypothetical protein AAGH99_07055 [Planctomycetota bacterium]